MTSGPYRFEEFLLDPGDRRLTRGGKSVELNARYLDALVLLVGEEGRLVTKDRFMSEVWRGVPVTDEALTQCIRTLRRLLDDSATRPRFIETVTGHGYRFVAKVEIGPGPKTVSMARAQPDVWRQGLAGLFGGGAAGALGGLVYGFVVAGAQPAGAASVVIVVLVLTVIMALTGGAGVGFGIAAARRFRDGPLAVVLGAALGGMATGAVVKLVGIDAFDLLFGRAPMQMTGAGEGVVLGAATGLGVWLGLQGRFRRGVVVAGLCGALGGGLIALCGGRLMLGSLVLLGDFPGSHLRLAVSPAVVAASACLESALFAACIVAAMRWERRSGLK